MRIVYFLRNIYPFGVGGVELTYYYLLHHLKKYNIYPIILSEYPSKDFETWRLKKWWPYSIFVKIQLLYFFYVKRKKYDIIHVPYMHTSSYLNWVIFPFIKIFLRKNYVISIHGGRMAPWKPKWPHQIFFKQAMSISATNEAIAKEYKRRTGKNILVIPSQIPLFRSKKTNKEILNYFDLPFEKKIFLIVGSLKDIKSPLTVLKAANLLNKNEYLTKNNIHFVFAGDGPDKTKMKEFIKKNKIDSFVSLLGNVKRDLIPDLYKISYCYITASKFESYSKSMFEAVYNKVPVINTNVEVFSTILENEETSLFYEYEDFLQLSVQIKRIIEDQLLRTKIIDNAFQKFEAIFNYEKTVVEKYLTLYQVKSKIYG